MGEGGQTVYIISVQSSCSLDVLFIVLYVSVFSVRICIVCAPAVNNIHSRHVTVTFSHYYIVTSNNFKVRATYLFIFESIYQTIQHAINVCSTRYKHIKRLAPWIRNVVIEEHKIALIQSKRLLYIWS